MNLENVLFFPRIVQSNFERICILEYIKVLIKNFSNTL